MVQSIHFSNKNMCYKNVSCGKKFEIDVSLQLI
jgi:ribosomal protein L31